MNFFIISARSVGEAPLIDLPLMYVTLPAPDAGNKSSVALLGGSGSAGLVLTAVKPIGGEAVSRLRIGRAIAPLTSLCRDGEPVDRKGGCCGAVPSVSRLARMAVRRPFILWMSCRARAETIAGQR